MTEVMQSNDLLGHVLAYGQRGYHVFPCHWGKKTPATKRGFKDAAADSEAMRRWWGNGENYNIGIATGAMSDLLVVDIDPRNGGADTMTALIEEYGDLPITPRSRTGGGGWQYFFEHPGGHVPCSTEKIGLGIDIKADGGYVVVPPSLHPSGKLYAWAEGANGCEIEPQACPAWLLDKILRQSDGVTQTTAQGLGTQAEKFPGEDIPDGRRNDTLARYAGYLRRGGLSIPAIEAALLELNEERCKPPMGSKEVRQIAESVGRYEPEQGIVAGLDNLAVVWLDGVSRPDPQPIPNALPPVKPFDSSLLPEALRPWCMDIAERMQCPPDYPAVSAMIALGAIVGRRIGIRPKQRDDWLVIANLWGAIIGRPSSMKSPPLKEAIKPLKRLIKQADAEYEAAVQEAVQDSRLAKIRKSVLESQIKGLMRNNEDCDEQMVELQALDKASEPRHRRYATNDTSAEALGELMAANPNGILAWRDELIGLLKYLEREGQESARGFFLEAWDGNTSVATDRIMRGHVRINGACLSLLGTIQPGVLTQYLTAAVRGGTGDDGLVQRFQLAVWPDDPGAWKSIDRWPDTEARDRAFEVFKRIDETNGVSFGGEVDISDEDGIPFVRFDGAAQERFSEWMHQRENHLRSGAEHAAMESHLTKYRSLIPSLSLLAHLADGHVGSVRLDSLECAIGWGDYLESHARRIYSIAIHHSEGAARVLAERIVKGDVPKTFRARDVQRKGWSGLSDKDSVHDAIDMLMDLDWLACKIVETNGRSAKEYSVNPKISAEYLESELT